MAYRVLIYSLEREEVVEDEDEADSIVDHESRVMENYCKVVECSDDECRKK
jgi:hypothetical protein